YEDKPSAHIRVEFALDVLRVARGRYPSRAYLDFIGFQVATPLLERTFREIYGLDMKDVFGDLDLAIGTYRRTASRTIPRMTEIAWESKKDEILASTPDTTREKFVYVLARNEYEKRWGKSYRQPGHASQLLKWLIRIVPKVGP